MLEASGIKNVRTFDNIGGIGKGIHEMGTARMGADPKTSVLNKNNQILVPIGTNQGLRNGNIGLVSIVQLILHLDLKVFE